MSQFSIILVSNPLDPRIDQAVDLAVRAFEGAPTVYTMTGSNLNLRHALFGASIRAGAVEGSLFLIEEKGEDPDTKKIAAFAVWFPPGVRLNSNETQRSQGWNEYFASLTEETRSWWKTEFMAKHNKSMEEIMGPKSSDSWFCSLIATDPRCQGKGYASILVETACHRAFEDGKPAALATQNEDNVAWYQKHNFKVKARLEISTPAGGSWPHFILVRE